ncbi:MAG: hypothetical protein NVS3B7_06680 [Candidatus Elarobacter sp.]
MDAAAREKAGEVIDRFGEAVFADPRRFESILSDVFAGEYRRERIALVTAVRERVPNALRSASNAHVPPAVLLAQVTDRLTNSTAMDADAARWAVETLALLMHVPVPSASAAPDVPASPQTVLAEPLPNPNAGLATPRAVPDLTVPSADLVQATVAERAFVPPPPQRPTTQPPGPPPAPWGAPTQAQTPTKRGSTVKTLAIVLVSIFGVLGVLFVLLVVVEMTHTKSRDSAGSGASGAATANPVAADAPSDAAIASSFVPYHDGAIWKFRCVGASRTTDLAQEFHAVSRDDMPDLALFRATVKDSAGSVTSDSLEGADAHGNAFVIGSYENGVLWKQPHPVLVVPADPQPGFSASWKDSSGETVRTFLRTADVKLKSGVTVREAIYRDERGGQLSELIFVKLYGLAMDIYPATKTTEATTCRRND